MRFRLLAILSILTLGGCSSSPAARSFSVYFQAFSSNVDQQARTTISDAATYAQGNQKLPVIVTGYSAPTAPAVDTDKLSAQRATAVSQILAADGVAARRITTAASGAVDPKPLPSLSVRRVDITIGDLAP